MCSDSLVAQVRQATPITVDLREMMGTCCYSQRNVLDEMTRWPGHWSYWPEPIVIQRMFDYIYCFQLTTYVSSSVLEDLGIFTYVGIEMHLGFELAKMWMHPCINGPVGEQPGLRCICVYIYIYRLYMVIWQVHDVVGIFKNTADSGRVNTFRSIGFEGPRVGSVSGNGGSPSHHGRFKTKSWSPGRLWTQDRKKVVGTLGPTSPPRSWNYWGWWIRHILPRNPNPIDSKHSAMLDLRLEELSGLFLLFKDKDSWFKIHRWYW